MAVTAPPIQPNDGVIKEARRRQFLRRLKAAGAVLLTLIGLTIGLWALFGGGGYGHSNALNGRFLAGGSSKLALVHGQAFIGGEPALIGVAPSLQAGNVGVCIQEVGVGSCNGSPPTSADPVYGGGGGFSPKEKVGPSGEIDVLFTGASVAAVRVAHLGTFKAHHAAGLPPGAKEVIFYRPPGSRGTVLPPGMSPQVLQGFEHAKRGPALTETLLGTSGRPIPVRSSAMFQLANSYWEGTQAAPSNGRCAMNSSSPAVRTLWGQVATDITADHAITTPAWFSCLNVWFSLDGTSYETAILLNAKSPGSSPAPLWNAMPVPGHPGMVQIPAVQREVHIRFPSLSRAQEARQLAELAKRFGRAVALRDQRQILRDQRRAEQLAVKETHWQVFTPLTVARRVGPAWLLVRYGTLAQQIAFLQSLHITKLNARN